MIVQILAVIDGCLLDLTDRSVDLGDANVFAAADGCIARAMFEQPSRRAQIAQGM
jgi:hypothetical protein